MIVDGFDVEVHQLKSLGQLIVTLGERCATRPAIQAPGQKPFRYSELAEACRSWRERLAERDLAPHDLVGVAMTDTVAMSMAFVAIAACGVCVPLNLAWSRTELKRYVDRLPLRAVVTDASDDATSDGLTWLGPPVLAARGDDPRDAVWSDHVDRGAAWNGPATRPLADLALLLTTSGTTGDPKIVMLTHDNLLRAAMATATAYQLTPRDCRLNIMPLTHVQGLIGSVLATFCSAGRLVCAPNEFDAGRVVDLLREETPSWFSASPTMHRAILEEAARRRINLSSSSLRFVRSGSAGLPPMLRADLEQAYGVPVVESYGMTEAHQIASTPVDGGGGPAGSVGRATGSKVALLTPAGTVVYEGEGELIIRGRNVSPGYYGDEAATLQAMHAGWLRTGDIGRIDGTGHISITGRSKDMINRGGEKIAPAEIDQALQTHPGVEDAAAFAMPDQLLGEAVAAAVVLRPDFDHLDDVALRRFLAERLSRVKIPKYIYRVESISRTGNGKPQRHVLAATALGLGDGTDIHAEEGALAMLDQLESTVVGAFRAVLSDESIGADDAFLDRGGDSITGIRLITALRLALGIDLSVNVLFDRSATPRNLATMVRDGSMVGDGGT